MVFTCIVVSGYIANTTKQKGAIKALCSINLTLRNKSAKHTHLTQAKEVLQLKEMSCRIIYLTWELALVLHHSNEKGVYSDINYIMPDRYNIPLKTDRLLQ